MPLSRRNSPARQARRYPALRVSLRSSRLSGEVLNLSARGAAIETRGTPPRIGADVLCELETEQTVALVAGEIRWCRLKSTASDGNGDSIPRYRAGIRFTNGSPRNLLRILRALGLQRPRGEG